MRNRCKYLALVGSLIVVNISDALAQQPYGFHDLEQRLWRQSRPVAAAWQRKRALHLRLSAARWQYWPEISASYRIRTDAIDLSDDELNATTALSVRLSQDLLQLWKVRAGRLDEAQADLDIANAQLGDAKSQALLQFRTDYLDLLTSRARVDHYSKLTDIYLSLMAMQKTRYRYQEGLLNSYLDVEKQYIHFSILHDHYQRRYEKQKTLLAASFELKDNQIRVHDLELAHPSLDEARMLEMALANSPRAHVSEARARVAAGQATVARYQDLRFAPYVGLNFRGQSQSAGGVNGSGTEFGLRLSFPLLFPFLSARKSERFTTRAHAWEIEAEIARTELEKQVQQTCDQYLLLTAQIEDMRKLIEWNQEKQRVEHSNLYKIVDAGGLDRANLLLQQAEVVKNQLQYQLNLYERDRVYYRLLYLAGLHWPREMPVVPSSAATEAAPARINGVWLWKVSPLLAEKASRQAFVEFCRSKAINQVYLSVSRDLIASGQRLLQMQGLIRRLHASGIKVSALFGDPRWVHPKNRQPLFQRINFILTYNENATAEARFDGVHLDIEPHALREWPGAKRNLLQRLAETVHAARLLLSQNNATLPLEIDLPTFYHKVDVSALKEIIRAVDVVTLMAYHHKTSERVLAILQGTLALMAEQGRPFVVGINTTDFPAEKNLNKLKQQLASKLRARPDFAGFAVHDYHRYQTLAER
ncbi:MAG: TolC family protein [bacterium]